MYKVCHLSSAHQALDTRIFYKECVSLSSKYEVYLVARHERDEVINNVHIMGIPMQNKNRFFRMTLGVYYVLRKALIINAALYHFHDPELIPVGLFLRCMGKKVIYDVHEDYPASILSKYWIKKGLRIFVAKMFHFLEDFTVTKMSAVVTVHDDIRKRLCKLGRVIILYNYPQLTPYQEQIKENRFVWLGGLSDIRGKKQVFESFKNRNFCLEVIGKVSGQVCEHDNIRLLGTYSLKEALKKAGSNFAGLVTYLPEPNHIDALPNKLFEYMSLGIAVVASDFPKWRKIVDDAKCGILVDPMDANSIQNALQWMYTHYDDTINMGKNGRLAIEEKYNWSMEENKLFNLYEEVLNQ